mmetsp:Transcript_16388/g.57285  ORF Transcript_16388/g.57285 Transcript_16388/m.57285 type:complete len:126 (+) Transcript_16388:146-523(+)
MIRSLLLLSYGWIPPFIACATFLCRWPTPGARQGKKNGTAPAEGRPAVAAARAQLMFEKVAARGASPGLVRPSAHLGESLLDSPFCIDAKSWPVDPNEAASADPHQVCAGRNASTWGGMAPNVMC